MERSRATDAYGLVEGHSIQVADADQAYTQSFLEDPNVTRASMPRDQWPWRFRDPVRPLGLSLNGHPAAGGYWERHCDSILLSRGWKHTPTWRSRYWREERQTFLIVCRRL